MKSPAEKEYLARTGKELYSDAPYKREKPYLLWWTIGVILLIGVVQLVKGL